MPVQNTLQTEGEQEYEVQEILDARTTPQGQEYLVAWKDYSAEENSWEPKENLRNCQQAINSYHQQHPETTSQKHPTCQKRKKERQEIQSLAQVIELLTA